MSVLKEMKNAGQKCGQRIVVGAGVLFGVSACVVVPPRPLPTVYVGTADPRTPEGHMPPGSPENPYAMGGCDPSEIGQTLPQPYGRFGQCVSDQLNVPVAIPEPAYPGAGIYAPLNGYILEGGGYSGVHVYGRFHARAGLQGTNPITGRNYYLHGSPKP